MKLLIDQNLSFKLCSRLSDLGIEIRHVGRHGMVAAGDVEIWAYASSEGCDIVTMDGDFAELVGVYGHPPRVIWLRCGNQPTDVIEPKLRQAWPLIVGAMEASFSLIEVY